MSFNIDIKLEAQKLGKDLEKMSEQIEKNLKTAIKQLSLNVYNEADRLAAQSLHTSREDYRNALKYEDLGNDIYVVYLDPKSSANYFEEGFSSFDQKIGLLNGPKSRVSSKGKRYNIVPLDIKPYSKEPTRSKVVGDLRQAVKSLIKDKSVESVTRKFNEGKGQFEVTSYKTDDPKLSGLTKVTQTYKKVQQSQYLLFRVVSENTPSHKWIHPGFEGLKIFENELPKYVKENLNKILGAII